MTLSTIKLDSKGRIAIPMHMRNIMHLDNGDELLLETNENSLKMCPISKGDTRILINFSRIAALRNVINLLNKMHISILENESEVMEKGFLWSATINAKNVNIVKIRKDIRSLDAIENVLITRN